MCRVNAAFCTSSNLSMAGAIRVNA